ncbi:hypothetical protein Q1695_009152 [Nippostrongylus brasiliensis]|nr:hypothetical protein Q1695_009152 [Nippostrongylus brasiliensis]
MIAYAKEDVIVGCPPIDSRRVAPEFTYPATFKEGVHWLESPAHINSLFSAIAIGCLLGTIPGPLLIHLIGVRGTMALYGTISAFATLAFPFAVRAGFVTVFVMRILQGVGTGFSYPATGMVASQWSTTRATGTFIALLSCHVQFCSIFTMPVAGTLCESRFGWPSVFYLQGGLSALAFLAFFLFYKDDPKKHRNVSSEELDKITRGKHGQEKQKAPYRAIATDRCILGIWLSNIGGNLGFQIFLLYGPTYINKVLHYDVTSTGFVTALPYILSAMMKFAVGPISDRATCISDRWRLIFFAAFSQGVMALSFLSLVFITNPVLAQAAYTLTIVSSGINVVGTVKCAQMVARQHVHIVMAVVSFLLCVIVLLIPVAVNTVCPDNTPEQWSHLFLGISVIIIVANIPFVFVARSEPAPWTGNRIHAALPEKISTIQTEDLK